MTTMPEMNELIAQLIEINDECAQVSQQLESLKARRTSLKNLIISQLNENGLTAASAYGKTAKVVTKYSYSVIDPEKFNELDSKYHTAALYGINSKKLNAFCSDLKTIYGEIPADLLSTLSGFEYNDISFTKSK